MFRSLRKIALLTISIISVMLVASMALAAQTTDTDTEYVGLNVTGSQVTETPTATETETPTETATATETETPTETVIPSPTPTEEVVERCPHAPDNAASGIDPNLMAASAAQRYPLGTPCNPLSPGNPLPPGKVAGPVTQLPNTGARAEDATASLGIALLAITGVILTGSAAAMIKQRS